MEFYYFNDNVDEHNRHEVHTESCSKLPSALNRTYIGLESSCYNAIETAKRKYPTKLFDGCYWCSNSCHTG